MNNKKKYQVIAEDNLYFERVGSVEWETSKHIMLNFGYDKEQFLHSEVKEV